MGQVLAATHTHAKSSPGGAVCTPLPPPPPSSGTGLAMSDEGGRNTSWGKGLVPGWGLCLGKEQKEISVLLWVKTVDSYLSSCKRQGLMTDQSNPR